MEDEKKCRVGGMYEAIYLRGKAPDYCFVAGVARLRLPEGAKTNGEQARAAQRTNQPQQKQKGQSNSPILSIAVFDSTCGVL